MFFRTRAATVAPSTIERHERRGRSWRLGLRSSCTDYKDDVVWLGRDSATAQAGNVFSTAGFHRPQERFGDIFPLPLPRDCGYACDVQLLRSRRSRQQVVKRRTLGEREVGTVWALNHLADFSDQAGWPQCCLNRAQKSALSRIRRAHCLHPPPVESLSPQAALRQLLKRKAAPSYAGDQQGQLVSYARESSGFTPQGLDVRSQARLHLCGKIVHEKAAFME